METVLFMEAVEEKLQYASKFGLDSEVLCWALRELCKDDKKILEALEGAIAEWVK